MANTDDTSRFASAAQLWRLNTIGALALRDEPAEPLERGVAKEVLAAAAKAGLWTPARGARVPSVPDGGFNFRRFLPEKKIEPPPKLTELAESKPDTPTTGAGPFAGRDRIDGTGVPSPAPIEKTARPKSLQKIQKMEPLDPRSWAAWKQQRSTSLASLMNRKF